MTDRASLTPEDYEAMAETAEQGLSLHGPLPFMAQCLRSWAEHLRAEPRIFVCEMCGGDGGWSPEHDGQYWLTCSACNGEGEFEADAEPVEEADLYEEEAA